MLGTYYVTSIKSRLPELRAKAVSSGFDDEGDFELGTQLSELTDLCCKMNGEGRLIGGDFQSEGVERDILVECPLCGIDTTGLTEELRQVHTNACLDKKPADEATVNWDIVSPYSHTA